MRHTTLPVKGCSPHGVDCPPSPKTGGNSVLPSKGNRASCSPGQGLGPAGHAEPGEQGGDGKNRGAKVFLCVRKMEAPTRGWTILGSQLP